MRNMIQLFGGVAVAGAVAAGSTALTGTGLGVTGNIAASKFVGGAISQTVTGATLDQMAYTFVDGTNTVLKKIDLTFTVAADGTHVAASFTGGSGGGNWTCGDVSSLTSSCTPNTTGDRMTGITGVTITVS